MPKVISLDEWERERNRRFIDAKRRVLRYLVECHIDKDGSMKVTNQAYDAIIDLFEAISGTFDWEQ